MAAVRNCSPPKPPCPRPPPKNCSKKSLNPVPPNSNSTAAVSAAVPTESAAGLLRAPSRRRLKSAGLVPIGAQLVVLLALLRIAQDFVSLIELFKLFLRRRLVLVDVGMVFSRQLAKSLADFVFRRGLGNAQRLVIISELNSHARLSRRFCAQPADIPRTRLATANACLSCARVGKMLSSWRSRVRPRPRAGSGAGWLIVRRHSDRALEFSLYFPIVTCIIISVGSV